MRLRKLSILVLAFVLPLLAVSAYADTVPLGTDLSTFAVLGASTVTNTNPATNLPLGPTTITGNVGDWATSTGANAVTGLEATQVSGTIFQGAASGTTTQALAQDQLDIAMGILAGLPTSGTPIAGGVLDGLTRGPGVYALSAPTFNLSTGAVFHLDAQNLTNPLWVFQASSSLITGSGSVVDFVNAPSSGFNPGVFWVLPGTSGSATLGTNSTFQGIIAAEISVGLNTGAKIGCGAALADTGAVTMDTNTISIGCNGFNGSGTTGGGGGTGGGSVPEPSTFALLSSGLAIGLLKLRKLR
jgi:Ice-binding-like